VTTDHVLMGRVAAGDAAALDQLFRRHHARVHALCSRLSGDSTSADDLVQETFLRVLRHAGRFEARSSFSTWLYRIARNVCLDHWKRSERDQLRARRAARELEIQQALHDSEKADVQLVERALTRLPVQLREVLVLSRLHDLPTAEVAAIVGCSEGAARVRLHRAMTELRKILLQLEAVR
jgi:RNA polymerase sigma-70 factor (ECF subfamily)